MTSADTRLSGLPAALFAAVVLTVGCSSGGSGPDLPMDQGPADNDTGSAVPCQVPDDCKDFAAGFCQAAVCSLDLGRCIAVADTHKDGTPCDPDDLCASKPKVCDNGACVYTAVKECPGLKCRVAKGCVPQTGDCEY
ncbi:MAG: hypothetical protein GXP54_06915, partial [Deltaproteobacteria bacterium]|nr:hypothetical protein [Deltaproteobacteria bacterium]